MAVSRVLLLGATGDLAGRLVLPALARLVADGQVPGLQITGAAPQDLDDAAFAALVTGRLDEHAPDVPQAARRALVEHLTYTRIDLGDPRSLAAAARASSAGLPVAVYLALPPRLFRVAVAALAGVDLPPGSRIVVEKPFGDDERSAVALNALLDAASGGAPGAVFRVDHALGMPGAADLLARRGRGGPLEAVWNGTAVAQVDVLWEETLALEGRADFYDRAGALKDVLQNHLLQVLVLAAVELPAGTGDSSGEDAVHAAKLDLLRSLHAPDGASPQQWTRRARYTAGTLARAGGPDGKGRDVPDYTAERGVDPARSTETHVELVLVSDAPQWAGTRFVLRSGKALAADRKGVLVHLRPDAPVVQGEEPGRRVWIDLDERSATGERVAGEVAAYTRVLAEVLSGGTRLSVSAAESEQAWRVVQPALDAWGRDEVALQEYPAGSSGPEPLRPG